MDLHGKGHEEEVQVHGARLQSAVSMVVCTCTCALRHVAEARAYRARKAAGVTVAVKPEYVARREF